MTDQEIIAKLEAAVERCDKQLAEDDTRQNLKQAREFLTIIIDRLKLDQDVEMSEEFA